LEKKKVMKKWRAITSGNSTGKKKATLETKEKKLVAAPKELQGPEGRKHWD